MRYLSHETAEGEKKTQIHVEASPVSSSSSAELFLIFPLEFNPSQKDSSTGGVFVYYLYIRNWLKGQT